jgi:hypothetical protein
MPLTPKRKALEIELKSILSSTDPLSGQKLGKALSNFSKGILPPTIGVFTGIAPAAAAYDNAPSMNKTKGIEDAVNTFATFNATGMAPFGFQGTVPPKIRNLQRFFDLVKNSNGTIEDIAKFLSVAILANYTLGRSTFTPLNIPIPTWNIGILPGAVRDELDQDEIDSRLATAAAQADTAEEIAAVGQLESDEFFDEIDLPED